MEKRNIELTIETAERWYNGTDKELQQLAVQTFPELEKETTQYPIYCLSSGLIVKFDGLRSGIVVKAGSGIKIGCVDNSFTEHTNTKIWQQLLTCPEYGFYHKQPVWCWDDDDTHERKLMFFNANTSRPFSYNGRRRGASWSNYAPFEGEWFDWMNEAFNTLEK